MKSVLRESASPFDYKGNEEAIQSRLPALLGDLFQSAEAGRSSDPLSIREQIGALRRESGPVTGSASCPAIREAGECADRYFRRSLRFGHFSNSCRSSPGNSCGAGERCEIRNSTFGGSMCTQRRHDVVRLWCDTAPSRTVLQRRVTSRSSSVELALQRDLSDTCAFTYSSWRCGGRN